MEEKYVIDGATLTDIADPLRLLLGIDGEMTPEEMAANGQAVHENVTSALEAIAEKGVVVPDEASSGDLEGLIGQFKDQNYETWVFEMESGGTVEKEVHVG